jgi:putative transposase
MRDVVILLVHLIVTFVRLARPGGLRSVIADSVLVKHQLLILNHGRTRTKEPIGLLHPGVVRTSEACCRPVEGLHRGIPQKGASCQFSPLVPVKQLSTTFTMSAESRRRVSTYQDVTNYSHSTICSNCGEQLRTGVGFPSWLTFLGHMKDSLWSCDLFRCESATL